MTSGGRRVVRHPRVFRVGGRSYLLGSSRTKGYREYGGLGWCAHVARPID